MAQRQVQFSSQLCFIALPWIWQYAPTHLPHQIAIGNTVVMPQQLCSAILNGAKGCHLSMLALTTPLAIVSSGICRCCVNFCLAYSLFL